MRRTEQRQLNSKAIISLTLGVLAIFIPILGIVFGIAGIVIAIQSKQEIGEMDGTSRGLAISGMICSIAGIIIQLFTVFGFLVFYWLIPA